jgi:hypothetical protein
MIENEELILGNTTKSPARILVAGDESDALALVYLTDPKTRKRTALHEERAKRLVSCWNALIGMSSTDIEAMAAELKLKRETLDQDETTLVNERPRG